MPKTRRTKRNHLSVNQITASLARLSESELMVVFDELRRRLIERKEAHEAKAREYEALVTPGDGVRNAGRSMRSRGRSATTRSNNRRIFLPKYRNPDDPKETWSGQGRLPKWMPGRPKELSQAKLKRFRIGD
jgi:DNA-binding protein H-NS